MKKFDKNYMKHDFEPIINNYRFYRCAKCKCSVYYFPNSNEYYMILDLKDISLTCDEVIIKNVIE